MAAKFGYNPAAVFQKYMINTTNGRAALVNGVARRYPTKMDFVDSWALDFNGAALYTPASVEMLNHRVTRPLAVTAQSLGFDYFWAGLEDPPTVHTTVLSAYVPPQNNGLSLIERFAGETAAFDGLKADEELRRLLAEFPVLTLEFDFLMVGGNNLALAVTEIPEQILKVRQALAVIYNRYELPFYDMTNIWHITLGRLRQLSDSEFEREKFLQVLEVIDTVVRNRPLSLTVSSLALTRDIQRQLSQYQG